MAFKSDGIVSEGPATSMRRSFQGDVGMFNDDENYRYKAVVNHEGQYSIWPVTKPNPAGWRDTGKLGTKAECLLYIKEVWTDMRPLSLRKSMETAARG